MTLPWPQSLDSIPCSALKPLPRAFLCLGLVSLWLLETDDNSSPEGFACGPSTSRRPPPPLLQDPDLHCWMRPHCVQQVEAVPWEYHMTAVPCALEMSSRRAWLVRYQGQP